MAESLIERLLGGIASRFRVNAGAWFTGDLTLQQGTNVDLQKVGNVVTISAVGGGGSGISEIVLPGPVSITASPVNLLQGAGVAITGGGSDIELAVDYGALVGSVKAFGQAALVGDVVLKGGTNVTLTQTAQEISFAVPNSTAFRLRADANGYLAADTTLASGTGVALVQSGSTITLNGLRLRSGTNAYLAGDTTLAAGNGVTLGQSGSTITITGTRARANAGAYGVGDFTFQDTASVTVALSSGVFSFTGFSLPSMLSFSLVGSVMTMQRSDASAARQMRFELYSSNAQTNQALGSAFDWAFTNQTGGTVVPFAIFSAGAQIAGSLTQAQPTSSVISVSTDTVSLTTTSASAQQIRIVSPQANQAVTITVALMHDDGSATGRTVYTHTYRRGSSGAPVAQGTAADLSVAAKKLGHSVTFTIATNDVSVNVVAASASNTKHRGQISVETASI